MTNFWEQLPKPILALAPMCGVSDLPFRTICHKYGADVVYSEMIMVQGLARHNAKTLAMAAISATEQPVVIQLGGNDPELFYKAAQIIKEIGPAGIDINFGCPAKKIAGQGSGVALLRDLELSYQIIQATIEGAGGLPVSIKTRSQIKSTDKAQVTTSLELLEKIKDLPVACVMMHGRSYEAPWIEEVDYDYIAQVKQTFKGIVLANGGIYSPEVAKIALQITQADGLGIGHGVYGRPWIFQQIKDYLATGTWLDLPWTEKRQIAIEHARLAFALKGSHGLIEYRKQLLNYVKGLPGATDYRQKLVQKETLADIESCLNQIS
jgi:nifR3 family TIM-barrel protein